MIRLLRHDPSIPREDDGAIRFDDIMEKNSRQSSMVLRNGQVRFQYCLNPNSSKHFLYFRAIQGHSGGNLVDPALQDNVLLPEDFTEYIYHVGNASEIHSIIRSGLIPCFSLQ